MAHRLCALTPARRWLVVRAQRGKRGRKRRKNAALRISDDSSRLSDPCANVTRGVTVMEPLVTENFNTMMLPLERS